MIAASGDKSGQLNNLVPENIGIGGTRGKKKPPMLLYRGFSKFLI
tara:strand:- start:55514 stop:55648 length:135 start_codon:yes stop_codon:yes gene_type:complete